MTEWTTEDRIAAAAEGWDLFDSYGSDNGPLQIQKFDSPEDGEPALADDTDAWVIVWKGSVAGSELHQRALAIVKAENPTEYDAIRNWMATHPLV